MPVNRPFTLEIIMCLTLNSAAEWAGSMFHVVVVAVAVVMFFLLQVCMDAGKCYSLQQVFCGFVNISEFWRRGLGGMRLRAAD
jgi:hypothetical protein